MQSVDVSLLRTAFLFSLKHTKFTNSRKGSMENVSVNADKSRLKLSKKLIESDEYDAIVEHQRLVSKWVKSRGTPSFFEDGMFMVRKELAPQYNEYLENARRILHEELVPAFQATYPAAVEIAMTALGNQFEAKDYPTVRELVGKFGLTWNWITIGVPEDLPEALRQAEAQKLTKQFEDAEEMIVGALREGFSEIIAHVTDRLQPDPASDKPKIFRNTLFEELTEFIEHFHSRNLANDAQLDEMVQQANVILARVKGEGAAGRAESVRESAEIRAQTAEAFAKLKANIDTMEKPRRRFDFSQDEPASVPAVNVASEVTEVAA